MPTCYEQLISLPIANFVVSFCMLSVFHSPHAMWTFSLLSQNVKLSCPCGSNTQEQQGGGTDEAEPFMGSGRFGKSCFIFPINCNPLTPFSTHNNSTCHSLVS